MPPSVTISQVAEAAGVSPTTVSFVLNNRGNISEETRARVLGAISNLGYIRSAHARNLRDKQARVIGYALDKNRSGFNPVLDSFLYHVLRLCEAQGRNLLVFSHDDHEVVTTAYRRLYDSRQVDGFILSHTRQDDDRITHLQTETIPFASFGRSGSSMDDITPWVDVDGYYGAELATRHLIEQGYERIGFIGWYLNKQSVSGAARYAGYRATLAAAGRPYEPRWEIHAENDIERGYRAATTLLDQPEPPDAIVAMSDLMALAVLRRTQEIGMRVGLTGFDNTTIAEFSHPTLTSLHQPVEQVARLLIDMLIAQLEDRALEQRHVLLKPELIVRASSLRNC